MRAAVTVVATLAFAFCVSISRAAPVETTFTINNGSYLNVSTQKVAPYFGTLTVALSPTNYIIFGDVTFPGLGLEFNTIRVDGACCGSRYQFSLSDPTDQYSLALVIDDPTAMFGGINGSTIDVVFSSLIQSGTTVANNFTGTVDVASVDAPASLPVFASALAMLGMCRRQRSRSTV